MSGPDSLLSRLILCPTFEPVLFCDTAVYVTVPLVTVNQCGESLRIIFTQQLLEEKESSPFSVSELMCSGPMTSMLGMMNDSCLRW